MLVPVACRFVPHDQWLITRLDDAAKVKHAKHWILSKCNVLHLHHHLHQHQRPVSPITFAHTRAAPDSPDDGYSEDDEFSDTPPPPQGPAPPPPSSPVVAHYTLLSFSTGAILEDEFALSWYSLRPYELLELHPARAIVPLRRDLLARYIQPYFHANARVLWNRTAASPVLSEKRRKHKIDWKARCLVIHHGILSLAKDHLTSPPLHQFALRNMTALCGADALGRAFAIPPQPRAVCIQFGPVSPPLSSPSSPIAETTHDHDPSRECSDPQGEWLVLDMLDDNAFSSILRVLHRQASHPISSSFVPSLSTVTFQAATSAVVPHVSLDTVPYPEWRINTVENARKAGIGDVGKPMAWILWTEQGRAESLLGNIRHHRHAFSREMQYKTSTIPDMYRGPDDDTDSDSEMEWEGWMRDLERQCRVRQRTETVRSRQRLPSSISSSPPLSEASPSGSPRGRSPSLSTSHSQYPNIDDVIQPDRVRKTTVSTVSVGTSPPSRRRSSTLSSEASKPPKRKDKEPFPGVAPKARARPVGAGLGSPGLFVRHVHSSSNLRISSSPIYESDAAESSTQPGPSSPSRRQSAFMRTVSLRAGKIVKGLESAIDFVDDKTT